MKPNLAADFDEKVLLSTKGPFVVTPKIDGVRGLHTEGLFTGRSLKKHKNRNVTKIFSAPEYAWMDGECTITELGLCHPRLCNLTSSAMRKEDRITDITWNVFDLLTLEALKRGYADRIQMVWDHLAKQHSLGLCEKAMPIEFHIVKTGEEVLEWDAKFLDLGYEGTVYRLASSLHKQGRSSLKQGGLIRIKRFVEEEVMVTGFTEGDKNENEKQTNELGNSFRTSHKDNKVPNGMIGNILGYFIKDGREVTAGAGCMTHEERKYYFDHPEQLVGQIIKVKHFPKGVKDKARFPTFQSFRDDSDMSEG